MGTIDWRCRRFDELSREELYELLRLRAEVFVVEQNCPYQDLDGHDQAGQHVLGYRDDKLVAYTRLLPPGIKYDACSIGRVVTSPEVRRDGFGRELMKVSISYCSSHWPGEPITISAQQYLENFYQQFGFVTESEPYQEDGIPHIRMCLKVAAVGFRELGS